jgi:hypothetical protein
VPPRRALSASWHKDPVTKAGAQFGETDGPCRPEAFILIGVASQIIGLTILGAAFQFQQLASFQSYVAIGGLVIYIARFAFGLGSIFWLLISGIHPLKVRGAAMSAVTVTNWALNLVSAGAGNQR